MDNTITSSFPQRTNTMNRLKNVLMAIALAIFASAQAAAGGVKVIANSSVRVGSVSAAELKGIYLKEKNSLPDGTNVQPVLAKEGAAHESFLKEYLERSDASLLIYYRSLVFTGKGAMPKMVASDAEMLAYVAKTKGAIGYVKSTTPVEGVKVLEVK